MPTSFSFSQAQITQITKLRQNLLDDIEPNPSALAAAVPIYSYPFESIIGTAAVRSLIESLRRDVL